MHALAARDLLRVWEQGEGKHAVDKALILLAAACPEKTWDELVTLSVGRRDALLLTLRELTFGPELNCFTKCPQCGESLEFAVDAAELHAADPGEPTEPQFALDVEGVAVRARLPNSLDLAAVARCDDVSAARDILVQRCVLGAQQGEAEVPVEDLPEAVATELAAQMVEHDPLSEVQFDLRCPECEHHWSVMLDVVSFFWVEISAQAERLLREVAALARRYGWREADILAMSARRRQLYLEMVT